MRHFRLAVLYLLALCYCASLGAQTRELWKTYLARRTTTQIETAQGLVFAVADGSLYSFDPSDPSAVTLYDRSAGLSATNIADIVWIEGTKSLLIYYTSGMIDLLSQQGVRSISALLEASQIRQYGLSSVATHGDRVWLAGEFGMLQIDTRRALVEGTYFIGYTASGVSLSQDGQRLYALVDNTIMSGDLSSNLQDPSLWTIIRTDPPTSQSSWSRIATLGDRVIALSSTGDLYSVNPDGTMTSLDTALGTAFTDKTYVSLRGYPGKVLALASDAIVVINEDLTLSAMDTSDATDVALTSDGTELWIAAGASLRKQVYSGGQWTSYPISINIPGPYSNSYFAMRHVGGRLYSVNGGRDGNRYSLPGVVQIFDGVTWSVITSQSLYDRSGVRLTDPVDVIPHRDGDPTHIYVATWGEGLYELRDGALVERYDTHNSALASAIPGTEGYTRVGSLSYDRQGNLWMGVALTSNSSGGSIVRLSPEGTWAYYDYAEIRPTNSFGPHITLPLGTKWIAEHRGRGDANGVFVYRDNGTDDLGDDASARYLSFAESSGRTVNFSRVSAMAVDLSGALWLGTNIGYMSVVRPDQAPQAGKLPVVSRPIGGKEPPYYYILENVAVSAIAVDNLNRKWIGTETDGLYLVSENGADVLRHYRQENSPLVSNRVLSLSMDEENGILYIGTEAGLNSLDTGTAVTGQVTAPSAMAYPNPLRPEHPDGITFSNLPAGATIHISDVNGRVVHHATSIDTEHRWDTYTSAGSRVPSGVYTARIYAPIAGEAQTLRIAIIRSAE